MQDRASSGDRVNPTTHGLFIYSQGRDLQEEDGQRGHGAQLGQSLFDMQAV